mgnify:CR=1 FL=1
MARAAEELGKGDEKLAEPDPEMANHGIDWCQYDKAIDHFKNAWGHAQRAVNGGGGAQSAGQDDMPRTFALFQNQPNPVTQSTDIRCQIPVPSRTTLRVYDAVGRLVATLVDEELRSGLHTATWNTDGATSGIYFYKLCAGDYTATRKMLVLK